MSRSISQIVDEYNELIIKSGSNATIKKFRDKEYALIRLEALKTRLGIDYEPEDVGKVDVPEPQETSVEKVVDTPSPALACSIPEALLGKTTGRIVKPLLIDGWTDEEIMKAVVNHTLKATEEYVTQAIKYYKWKIKKESK